MFEGERDRPCAGLPFLEDRGGEWLDLEPGGARVVDV